MEVVAKMRWVRRVALIAVVGAVVFVLAGVTPPVIRMMYPKGRPGPFARRVNRAWAWLVASGLAPERWPGKPVSGPASLEVRGRQTGLPRATMATWVEYEGERYLVSMLDERSDWVRNIRAAGGEAVLRRRTRRPIRLEELPVEQRPPIMREWYRRTWTSARPHWHVDPRAGIEEFERLAKTHPVFHIVEAGADGRFLAAAEAQPSTPVASGPFA
jgi:hypothetical protein